MKKVILVLMVLIPVLVLGQSWNVEVTVRGHIGITEDLQTLNTDIRNAINNNLTEAKYDYEINIVQVQDSVSYYDVYLEIEGLVDSVDALAPATNTFFDNKFDGCYINFEARKLYNNFIE